MIRIVANICYVAHKVYSFASMDMPTFHEINLAPTEALSKWHGF